MPILDVPVSHLNLPAVLLNGQSFRWISLNGSFYGTAKDILWRCSRINDDQIEYAVVATKNGKSLSPASELSEIKSYFNLDVNLDKLVRDWLLVDPHIAQILEKNFALKGVRILNQEPFETLLAFICSANNNIKRISNMVNFLCNKYGSSLEFVPDIAEEEKTTLIDHQYLLKAFPTVQQLAGSLTTLENDLRLAKFGYRAQYISNTIKKLGLFGDDYLTSLKVVELSEAKEKLREFPGVGPKVADCICLMGLGFHSVVPVDTHVLKTTVREYRKDLAGKSLTSAVHNDIASFYEKKFGSNAGWAQAIIFNDELSKREQGKKAPKRKKSTN